MDKKTRERVEQSYWWREYGSKIDPNTKGVWQILGEDPNCDLGGYYHEPSLGTVRGTFEEALEYAVDQRGFFGWSCGRVVPLNIIDLEDDPFKGGGTFEGTMTGYMITIKKAGKTLTFENPTFGVRGLNVPVVIALDKDLNLISVTKRSSK